MAEKQRDDAGAERLATDLRGFALPPLGRHEVIAREPERLTR